MNNKITVVIPVYNTEKYIRKCIDSIVHQSYTNLEIIAVNDGSTDGTGAILDQYAALDLRIKVIHQKNAGHQSARKAGVEAATGDFIAFVDSDDSIARSDAFEKLIGAIDDKTHIVVGRINIDNGTTTKLFPSDIFSSISSKEYIEKYILCGRVGWNICAKLFRTTIVKSIEGNPINVTVGEDALYTIIIAEQAGGNVVMVNIPVYNYYMRNGSITKTKNTKYFYDNFLVADYIDAYLKETVAVKYRVAFRLLCMSNSFRYGWQGSSHPLNANAIKLYKQTPEVLQLFRPKKRLQIWLLINLGNLLSRYVFKNRIKLTTDEQ